MTKRKDKKGGALKGRALAAKDAVKSKATAVPGAEPKHLMAGHFMPSLLLSSTCVHVVEYDML